MSLEPVEAELVPLPGNSGALAEREPVLRDVLREAWLTAQRSRHTRTAYRTDLNAFFAFCDRLGRDPLNTVRLTVDQYRAWLLDPDPTRVHADGYNPATVARKIAAVSSFYDYCLAETTSAVMRNPATHAKRPEVANESETRGLSPDEIDKLIEACTRWKTPHALVIRLMIDTGLRVSEACRISTSNIEYEGGTMVVVVTRKGGKRQRIPVPDDIAEDINAMRGTRRGPIFVGARRAVLTGKRIAEALEVIANAAGIAGKVHPHMLRHAAATQLLNEGVHLREVQDLLGHSDPKTTYRYDRARRRVSDSPVHRLAATRRSRKTE
jgi:integrase/recombinase XerD